MKKNTVAIITLYGEYNIGNKLQHFAVEQIYKDIGLNVISFWYELSEQESVGNKTSKVKEFIKALMSLVGINVRSIRLYNLEKKRNAKFKNFSQNYLSLGPQIIDFVITNQLANKYDFYSVGSDQVWRNWTGTIKELEYFLLAKINPEKRICLSPSIGRESLPNNYIDIYINELSKFKYLSCREVSGSSLIGDATGRYVETLVDPTMAIDSNKWISIEKKPEFEVPSKYILVYFLGDKDIKATMKIKQIAEDERMPIIDIYNKEEYPIYYTCSPDEFLYLVNKASLICTNSFHGTVFSILFNRDFIYFERDDKRANMTDRVRTLLKTFDLEERIYQTGKNYSSNIDFGIANNKIKNERERLYEFVRMSVNSK